MTRQNRLMISYGNFPPDKSSLRLLIHPSNKIPRVNPLFGILHGTYFIGDSDEMIIGELLEDFLLNKKNHFPFHNFFGLRNRARRIYKRDIPPETVRPSDFGKGEIYPGFWRWVSGDYLTYILEDHAFLSLGSVLPYEFAEKARELSRTRNRGIDCITENAMGIEVFRPEVDMEQKYAVAVLAEGKTVFPLQSYDTLEQLKEGYKNWLQYSSKRELTKPVPIELVRDGKFKICRDVI